MRKIATVLAAAFAAIFCNHAPAVDKPLKVYILAGQSNMLGVGAIAPATTPGTLEYTVANDPDKAYQFLVDADGKWVVRDDVLIRYISRHGGLTPGYGGGHDKQPQYIGPELGFGHHVGDLLENPVLIIKASWGGKSLGADFRPPSSGGETGHYYKEVLRLVEETVADLQTYVPDYHGQGYDGMDFWQDADMSPGTGGSTHWNGNAKTYLNIGIAMADAMMLLAPGRCPFRLRAKGGAGSVTLTWKNGTEVPAGVRILRDGVKVAKAAPAGTASFIDRNARPGIHEYTAEFTMPGAGCDPLTTTFNGGITGLACSKSPTGLKLSWRNNMVYDAITVTRDATVLEAALPGDATSYTDTAPPSKGVVSYTVAPAEARDAHALLRLNFNLKGELGILDLVARGGINPTTRKPWQKGDQYHLAFVSSAKTPVTSQDLGTYDAFLTKLARSAGIGGNWRVIGSSWTDDARRHTSTYPKEDGEGGPIFLLDGTTIVANNYKDLWDGAIDAPIDRDEQGNRDLSGAVFTGSDAHGTKNGPLGGSGEETARVTIGDCEKRERASHWIQVYGAQASESLRLYALSEKLTVADGADDVPPVLKSITDDRKGESIPATKSVNYTVIFSEPMKASTVDVSDFGNASTAAVRIDSVARTVDPTVFEVRVTPREAGSLQLRIALEADLRDLVGNALDPQAAQPDETVIGVSAAPQLEGELGILDVTANGGINPGTGEPWKAGDRYRLVFVTSAGTQALAEDLGTYDEFLRKLVGSAGIGGNWKVIGSSSTVDARDHTSTNPDTDGAGEPVFLIDGVTRIADGYKDMWDGSLHAPINRDERGNAGLSGRVFTGSSAAGVKIDRALGASQASRAAVSVGDCAETGSRWMVVYNATASSSLPVYALSDPLTVKRVKNTPSRNHE